MTYLTSGSSGICILSLLFLFLFSVDDLSGQVQIKPDLTSASLVQKPANSTRQPDSGNLKIFGVMVEFLPDTNRFTSGDGTFGPGSIPYLESPGTNIDALPHDKNYFEAHLEFSKNYFETVSGGKISIDFEVLPEIYRLDQPMGYYSPTGENPDLSVMAEFVTDVWTLIGQSENISTGFTQGDDIAFVIFHAGVGRDIELTGTNLQKTPQDLPSLYLNKKTLHNFLDDPSFSGFPIDNTNLLVDNTLIVPRTLSRAGEDVTGNLFLLPLSVNGLLTAQIGSHLGLPDLFNTQTGESGIGNFGLMDGAGIFSYNGLFPPEPSAWEKVYMGWSAPFIVDERTEHSISVPAVSLRQAQSVVKIPISGNEYFLVENRHRDPSGHGITVTTKKADGTYIEQSFTNNDLDFTDQQAGFDDLLEPGVVVNVSNYDFSLPGGRISDSEPESSEQILNGGVLIWHIDESLILNNIIQGGINDNPDRRGVNLKEADGAQDIGRPAAIGLFQNEVNGSPFDFWWSGNTARVITQTDSIQLYQNRFAPDTYPDNDSNSGAPSYFELYDFSDNLPVASFKYRPVHPYAEFYELWDANSTLDMTAAADAGDKYWKRFPLAARPVFINQEKWILLPGYDGVQLYNIQNKALKDPQIPLSSLQQPFINPENGFIALAGNPLHNPEQFSVFTYQFDGINLIEESVFPVQPNTSFISSFEESVLDIDGTTDRINLARNEIIQNENNVQFSDLAGQHRSRIENGSLVLNFPGGTESFLVNKNKEEERLYTGLIENPDNQFLFYLLGDGEISLLVPDDGYQSIKNIHSSDFIDWPAFADLNGNANPDIIFVDYSVNQLIAKNINGAFLSSFPISAPEGVKFIGTPLIADLNGDEMNDIIITGYDSYSMNLYAYTMHGEAMEGFPLYVGGIDDRNSQPVHPLISENKLIAVSHFGDLKVWAFKNIRNVQWSSKYGNQSTNKVSGFMDFDEPPNQQQFLLNIGETYNWPNPARDETQLRYQTSEPAEIRIKILTTSGRIIADHRLQSQGGVSEELLLDTSSWASGGYFALVEARAGNVTERKLVKIAIAK